MFEERMMTTAAQNFGIRSPRGQFGIEIETEGDRLPAGGVTEAFIGKPDGSLREGMEYVSRVLTYDEVNRCVTELRTVLDQCKAKINPSYRSSTHIHYNMADRTLRDVLGMMVIWALVEPCVFRLMPPGRDGSLFCVSSYDSGELANFTDRFCEQIGNCFGNGFNPRGKYSSLNITRLGPGDGPTLGTIEYRVFPTSLRGDQIATWCTWINRMSEIVSKEEDHSFLSLVRYAEQNPTEFLIRIFGVLPMPDRDAAEYVDFGARTAYEMARVIDVHLKKKPRKKKEEVPANPVPFPPDGGDANEPAPRLANGGLRVGQIGLAAGERPRAAPVRRHAEARHPIPEPVAPAPRGEARRRAERRARQLLAEEGNVNIPIVGQGEPNPWL